LRPGGTVSGPTMVTLADFSVYVAIIATLGQAGIEAVTTNLNINFLAKPEPRDLIACVRLLRVGRRLAVGEAELFLDGGDLVPPRACYLRLAGSGFTAVGIILPSTYLHDFIT
jgi:acyl-coenzyme A thioesterase PaaI-like protein